jgi:hypothetical protein
MASKRRRHTPEQIIRKLREADRLAGEGQDVAAWSASVLPLLAGFTFLTGFSLLLPCVLALLLGKVASLGVEEKKSL